MFHHSVRKIGLGRRSITGKRPSQKTGTVHAFESALERDYLTLLEASAEVERYLTQPTTIHFIHINRSTRYTPDVAVYFKTELNRKPLLVEIKYEAELKAKSSVFEPKFAAAREYARNNDFEFKVFTETDIRTDHLENIKFLGRYRNTEINETMAGKIMNRLTTSRRLSVDELIADDNEGGKVELLFTVWQLLSHQSLTCEMHKKLSMNTIVWNPQLHQNRK